MHPDTLEAIWNYLRLESGTTAVKLWDELQRMRRLGCKYGDIPAGYDEFVACLERLRAQGRAGKVGELWIAEFRAVDLPKVESDKQRALFA